MDFFLNMSGETAAIAAIWNPRIWVFFVVFTLVVVLATIMVMGLFTRSKKQLRKELAAAEAAAEEYITNSHRVTGGPKPKSAKEANARLGASLDAIDQVVIEGRTCEPFRRNWDAVASQEKCAANAIRVAIATAVAAEGWKKVAQDEKLEVKNQLDAVNQRVKYLSEENAKLRDDFDQFVSNWYALSDGDKLKLIKANKAENRSGAKSETEAKIYGSLYERLLEGKFPKKLEPKTSDPQQATT